MESWERMQASIQPPYQQATVVFLFWVGLASLARGDDLTTLSGVTYRQVRMVRVEPDGVTWEHANGVCKVDFTDLPETVRKVYHYDPKQAAAFQDLRVQARIQAVRQAQEDERKIAAWRAKYFQTQVEATASNGAPGSFIDRRQITEGAAARSVAEQIETKNAAQDLLTKDDGTLWDRRLWAIPCLVTGKYDAGVAFDPHVDLNAQEFKASLHSQGPDFFNPDNMTKAYYKDVDRAAAFAGGRP